MITPTLSKDIHRLVDPNIIASRQDADDIIRRLDTFTAGMAKEMADDQLREIGFSIFKHDDINYYGRQYLDENVYGTVYIKKFAKNAYNIMLQQNGKWLFQCMVHGKTIIGEGNRHYRYFINEVIDKYERGMFEDKGQQ